MYQSMYIVVKRFRKG